MFLALSFCLQFSLKNNNKQNYCFNLKKYGGQEMQWLLTQFAASPLPGAKIPAVLPIIAFPPSG